MAAYLTSFNSKNLKHVETDVLVVGSGIAGLVAALECSEDCKVLLVTKSELMDTATWYAQGGIASAISKADSIKLHARDTIKAGAGISDEKAVRVLVENGPLAIDYLQKIGAEFDRIGKELEMALEGGHSVARIIHHKDATGSEVQEKLVKAVLNVKGIKVLEKVFVVDLLVEDSKVYGCLAFDGSKFFIINAHSVILTTGGAGQIYSQTTNPGVSTGDGPAIAYRAGAALMDMEFFQFHPTSLYEKKRRHFLITEALRGAGAYLINEAGERFMAERHPKADLAPRDIVCQEIVKEMKRFSKPYVYLDATHIEKRNLLEEFPLIYKTCLEAGYDIARKPVPVCPVAHFMIGGIKTDLNGQTDIEGLYASGECSCTGLHGANRLASNSLLEGIVFSRLIAKAIKKKKPKKITHSFKNVNNSEKLIELDVRRSLQKKMLKNAGIIRNKEGLEEIRIFLKKYSNNKPENNFSSLELSNMLTLATILNDKALEREESRGVHFRMDFPYQKESFRVHSFAKRGY